MELIKDRFEEQMDELAAEIHDGLAVVNEALEERFEKLKSRRLRRIGVAFELWAAMLKGELCPTSRTSCPEDLAVMGIYPLEVRTGDVQVLAWSSEFEPFAEDATEIPEITVHFAVEYLRIPSDRRIEGEQRGAERGDIDGYQR